MTVFNDAPPAAADLASSAELLRLLGGAWVAQAIGVAAQLGLADLMTNGPREVDALASATGTHPPSLFRLLRALASVGIFAEDESGRFGLTPLANGLRSDVPASVRAMCAMRAEPWFVGAWGELLHSVKTGEAGFDRYHGVDIFTFLEQHSSALALFAQAMDSLTGTETAAVLGAYDFSDAATIVDVGGGQGALLAAILRMYPAARGVVFDRPATGARAGSVLEEAGVTDRCQVIGGSFFESVPDGGDLYILKSVIHDWDDERSVAILQNCRRAMHPHARVLVIERVVESDPAAATSKWMDLNMLVAGGGRERTAAEYRSLLVRAGLDVTRIVRTLADVSLLDGVRS